MKSIQIKILFIRFYLVVILLFISICAKSQQTDAVKYNFKRGFYTDSFLLKLSSETRKSTIRYTLDGSKPSLTNGHDYNRPIPISSNTVVKTYAYSNKQQDSKIKTHSYIFPHQVIQQKNTMFEDYGFDYSTEMTGNVFWTEEMDSEIVNAAEYKNEIIQGLLDIPTLSIVLPKEDLWSENGIHWGNKLRKKSNEFERECSIEMIYPQKYKGDSLKSWQENAGIKIQGAGSRNAYGTDDHKQSFSLVFKKKYGTGKLKNNIFADAPHGSNTTPGNYDKIILRAGHNDSWGIQEQREKAVYTRDQLGRDLQIQMSGFGSHGTFVHLYLNGKYWGLYNPCERPDNKFLAYYFGGNADDYFYAKGKKSKESEYRIDELGQDNSRFLEACSKDYSKMPFQEMKNWVMIDQSIACFLIYGYLNPADGPQYYYGNNNNPPGSVVWIPWDVEWSLMIGNINKYYSPDVDAISKSTRKINNGFNAFWTNIDFKMRFNDLVYRHFFNKGAMTNEKIISTWDNLTNYIYKAIICESARWGDEQSSNPMDRDNEWNSARLMVKNDIKNRSDIFLSQLQEAGYFSTLSSPKYYIEDLEITNSLLTTKKKLLLSIKKVDVNGDIYYTTDGSDPRTWDLKASVSNNAIKMNNSNTTIKVKKETIIKARTLYNNEWSPLHEIKIIKKPLLFQK